MKKYSIKEGQHASRPYVLPRPRIGRSIRSAWRVRLGEGTTYSLDRNADQWNKLCGETFSPIHRSENAIMLAWRCVDGVHQVTPYYNVNLDIWMPERHPDKYDEWPVIDVKPGQDIWYGIHTERSRVAVTIATGDQVFTQRIIHPGTGCFQYEVSFWFGGSEAAPQRMEILKERLTLTKWKPNGALVVPTK